MDMLSFSSLTVYITVDLNLSLNKFNIWSFWRAVSIGAFSPVYFSCFSCFFNFLLNFCYWKQNIKINVVTLEMSFSYVHGLHLFVATITIVITTIIICLETLLEYFHKVCYFSM